MPLKHSRPSQKPRMPHNHVPSVPCEQSGAYCEIDGEPINHGGIMPKGIKRDIDKALKNVNKTISYSARDGGIYAGVLSSEGYNGGYRAALFDVIAALNGVPNRRSRFWPEI